MKVPAACGCNLRGVQPIGSMCLDLLLDKVFATSTVNVEYPTVAFGTAEHSPIAAGEFLRPAGQRFYIVGSLLWPIADRWFFRAGTHRKNFAVQP